MNLTHAKTRAIKRKTVPQTLPPKKRPRVNKHLHVSPARRETVATEQS